MYCCQPMSFKTLEKHTLSIMDFIYVIISVLQDQHGMLKMSEAESQFFLMLMPVWLLKQEFV